MGTDFERYHQNKKGTGCLVSGVQNTIDEELQDEAQNISRRSSTIKF
jgi:hypothetical protein